MKCELSMYECVCGYVWYRCECCMQKRRMKIQNQHSQTKLIALPYWWRKFSTMQCFTSCWIPLPFLLICCHIPQFYTELNSRMEFCSFWFQVKKKMTLCHCVNTKKHVQMVRFIHALSFGVRGENMRIKWKGNGKYFSAKKESKMLFQFNPIARTC